MKKSVSSYLFPLVLAVLFGLSSCVDLFEPLEENTDPDDEITAQLGTPGGFSVLSYSATEIKLEWEEVPGAESYRVERAVSIEGESFLVWESLIETEELTCIDSIMDVDEASLESPEYRNTYHYRVSACTSDEDYDDSEPAGQDSAMLFRAPNNVHAKHDASVEFVQLTWESSDGAEKYEVWRSDNEYGTSAEFQDAVFENEFHDTSVEEGVYYYYILVAVNGFDNKSLPTNPVRVTARLDTPQGFSAVSWSATEIKLQWEEVSDAESYMVERAVIGHGDNILNWEHLVETEEFAYIDRILDDSEASLESPEYQYSYHYRVSACTSDDDYDESEFAAEKAAMLFRAPNQVQATHGSSAEYVQLTWESSDGAEKYEVWRSDSEGGKSAEILSTVSVNEFRDSSVVQGVYFYYSLIAINGFGNKSLPTNPVRGFAKEYGALDSPRNVRFASGSGRGNSTDRITIEWDPVDHEDDLDVYYAVYRYSDSDYSLIPLAKKIVAAQFTDVTPLPGEYYYYQVQAIVDAGDKQILGEMSGDDQYGPLQGFVLSPPDTVIAAINQNGSATVKWLPPLGSESEFSGFTYAVYLNGTMTTSGVSHAVDENGFVSETVNSIASDIKVTTINGVVESPPSIAASLEVSVVKAIDVEASQNLLIQDEDANVNGVYPVKITWKIPVNALTASFRIERSNGAGFSEINGSALGVNGPFGDVYSYDTAAGIYAYIDRNSAAQAGEKYSYRVVSVYYEGLGDFPSDECSGWGAIAEVPVVNTIEADASQHLFIQGENANENGVYPVKITWKTPVNDAIASFLVERSGSSGFSAINETVLGVNGPFGDVYSYDPVTELYTYIDRNSAAQVGKKYSYRVISHNAAGQDSYFSNESTGWGALTQTRYMVEYNKVMNTALGKLDYMYRSPDTSKIGTESPGPAGNISGNIYYKGSLVAFGLGGAEIFIQLTNYSDFYVENDPSKGAYFILNGNSDTKSSMAASGNMRGTMTVTGMYPGTVVYGTAWSTSPDPTKGITISGGKAAGGHYVVTPQGFPGEDVIWNQSTPEPGIWMAFKGYRADSNVGVNEENLENNRLLPWYYWE
ncbi:MAG: hypothetical protein FWG46_02055 [Treponema sp.]|nr:hypothetical protein [Treponema sp.]